MKKVVLTVLIIYVAATAYANNQSPVISIIETKVTEFGDEPYSPFNQIMPTLKEMKEGWLLHYPVEYHIEVFDANTNEKLYFKAHKLKPPLKLYPGGYTLQMAFYDREQRKYALTASIKVKRFNWKEYADYYREEIDATQ